MKKIITDERAGLHYELVGDYYLIAGEDEPEQEQEPIGIWGQQHLRYLKEHHRARYANLLASGELNAYLADILFAFRNCAGHIVVQPHDDLAEADLAPCMIVPVIEIAFDMVRTPFYKLFLKVSGPCLHFLIGRRDIYLLCKNNHFSVPRFCRSLFLCLLIKLQYNYNRQSG